ncbi:hypothetical protein BE11_13605 [Sorangium cellulosum]|nr:hypothetical protein BE11_13605 [Sorangium cellulosum]
MKRNTLARQSFPGLSVPDPEKRVSRRPAPVEGHSDGMGPMQSTADMYRPWNSVHAHGSCADTAPAGGDGRVYCFAAE